MFFLGKIVMGSETLSIVAEFSNRFVVSGLWFMFLRYFEISISFALFIRLRCSLYGCEAENMFYDLVKKSIIFSRLLTDFSDKP